MAGLSQILEFVLNVDDKASAKFNQIGNTAQSSLGKIPGQTNAIGNSIEKAAGKSPLLAKGLDSVGVSGQQAGSMIATAMPAAMLAAGGAVAAFGVHAFGTFQDLAGSVLDFQRIVGGSAEESSAFVAVLDDYEISAEAGAAAIGKMAKAASNTPQVFAKFGVEIAKNADGTTNLQATLLNAAEAYANTGDDATKAALGAALFGKGYATLIPILEKGADGADGLAEAFANVEGQQILSQGQIDQAEDTRLALDELSDSVGELSIALGSALSPAVGTFASGLSDVVRVADGALGPVGGLDSAIGFMVESALSGGPVLKELREGIEGLVGGTEEATIGTGFMASALVALNSESEKFTGSTNAVEQALGLEATAHSMNAGAAVADKVALKGAADAADDAEAASKALDAALRDEAEAHRDAAAAIYERADAMRSSADKTFAVRKATDEFADSVSSLDADLVAAAEAGTTNEDAIRNQAIVIDDATQNAIAMADSVVDLAVEQSTAAGVTSTAADKTDLWNQQMIDAAATADGPLRDSILGHIADVNDIPPEKMTEIMAAIASGDLELAKSLLDGASAKRIAEIEAQAETAAANTKLDWTARDRDAYITAHVTNDVIDQGGGGQKSGNVVGTSMLGTSRSAAEQTEGLRGLTVVLRAATSATEDHSKAMSDAFDVVLAARKAELDYAAAVASSDDQLDSYNDTMNDAEASAADRVKAGIDLEKQLQAEAEKFVKMQEAIHEANGETYSAEQQVNDYNFALAVLAERLPDLADMINGYALSLGDLAGTIDEVANAQAAAEAATEAATEAYEAQQDALNDHTSDVLDSLQAERDYAIAVFDTKDELADYKAIMADASASDEDKRRAMIEFENQIDAEADAWVRLKEAQAEASGVEFTAEDRIKAYNEALAAVAARDPGWTSPFVNPLAGNGSLRSRMAVQARDSTYNITVNAGIGANGTQIGNELVRALREWERSNGPILAAR